ncbi:phosphatidylinositol-binding protein scs2 [Gonapodya sp. JEL0774]|nr:phosphatidylinositol-binding protein scs2 [Gonapodya sp. JEL0774]
MPPAPKPDSSVELVAIEPSDRLTFSPPFAKPCVQHITVTNISRDPIVFKMKTTAPLRYTVRPNSGVLPSAQSVSLEVSLHGTTLELTPDFQCKDKFLVQAIKVPNNLYSIETPAALIARFQDLWNTREAVPQDQYSEKKLHVAFIDSQPTALEHLEKIASLTLRAASAEAKLAIAEAESASLRLQITEITQTTSRASNDHNRLRSENTALLADNTALLTETAALRSEIAELRSENAMLRDRVAEAEAASRICAHNAAQRAVQLRPPVKVETIMYAVGDFEPGDADELRLHVGDRIFVNLAFADGWGSGFNTTTHSTGLFPLSHVNATSTTSAPFPSTSLQTSTRLDSLPVLASTFGMDIASRHVGWNPQVQVWRPREGAPGLEGTETRESPFVVVESVVV